MQNYITPLRNMEWREMFNTLVERVISYMSPAAEKEPKSGYQVIHYDLDDISYLLSENLI